MRSCIAISILLLWLVLLPTVDVLAERASPGEALEAQSLITLIEIGSQKPIPGPLPTAATMAAKDAALAPKVRAGLRNGTPASGWGLTECAYSDQNRFTLLMFAALRRLPQTCRVLMDAGADVNAIDQNGRTALIWAVRCGNTEVMRVLLAGKADPDIVDHFGKTAIDYAYASRGRWDNQEAVLRTLKRVGARPGPRR
jgi:hypothetical protein